MKWKFKELDLDYIKEYTKKNIRYFKWFIIYLMLTPVYGILNKPRDLVSSVVISFDDKIPFIKEFIIIYHTWYPIVILLVILAFFKNLKRFEEMMKNMVFSQIMAYITFFLFPTKVPRIELIGNDIFSKIIRMTWFLDNPYCGFPSIHVIVTCVIMIHIARSDFKKSFKYFVWIWGILVIISTLFVKQHVIMDVVGAIIVSLLGYIIVLELLRDKRRRFKRR